MEGWSPEWEETKNKIMKFPTFLPDLNTKENFPGEFIQTSYRWVKSFRPSGPLSESEYCLEEISRPVPLHFIGSEELVFVYGGEAVVKVGDHPGETEQAIKEQYRIDNFNIIGRSQGTAWSIEPRSVDRPLLVRTLLTPPLNHRSPTYVKVLE